MTGGIRIPIIADVSGAKKAVDDLGQSAKDAFSHVGDSKGVDYLIDGLGNATKQAEKLKETLGAAGNKGAAGVSKMAADAKRAADELAKAQRIQSAMAKQGASISAAQAKELPQDYSHWLNNNASASMRKRMAGSSFESVVNGGWRNMANGETAARRQYSDMLRQMGLGSMPGQQPSQQSFAAFMRQAMGGAGSTVLGSTGFAGSILQRAGAQASGGPGGLMSGAGMARLLGGGGLALGAYGIAKGVMATRAKIGSAEEENTSYSDMLRQMGSTSSTFETLRESVRNVSKNLDMSFGDGSKMASAYLSTGGLDGISSGDLGNELRTSGQFSRMLGVDPEQGAGFFGTMRNSKVSSGDSDNKRLAAMIGESIARAGVFSKSDEVLSSIANYTKVATSAALSPANTEGYVGAMGNALNLHSAGLDPAGAANMLGTVDSGFRHPGGEAQRNFLLGSLQKAMPGMTAVDMGFMQDGGMFARASDVFKAGNPAYDAADPATQARYDNLAKQGGKRTFFDMAMGQMSGMSTDMQRKNMMGLFPGLNDSSAARLQLLSKSHNGDISGTMASLSDIYGIDTSKMDPGAMSNLLDVHFGDSSKLKSKAAWFKSQGMATSDQNAVDAAIAKPGFDNEELKNVLAKMSTRYGMQMTDGDVSRKNMAAMDNLATDVATKLIPMTNAIREGIGAIAGALPGVHFKDSFANSDQSGAALTKALGALKPGDSQGRASVYEAELRRIKGHESEYTDEYRKRVLSGSIEPGQQVPKMTAGGALATTAMFNGTKEDFLKRTRHAAELAAEHSGGKLMPEWIQGQWAAETGWGSKVIKGTNNLGNIKGGSGPLYAVDEVGNGGKHYTAQSRFRSYKDLDEFGASYGDMLGGWRYNAVSKSKTAQEFAKNLGESGYATNPNYGELVYGTIKSVGDTSQFGNTPLPAGAPGASAGATQNINHTHDINIKDAATGAALAPPLRIDPNAPTPQGVR